MLTSSLLLFILVIGCTTASIRTSDAQDDIFHPPHAVTTHSRERAPGDAFTFWDSTSSTGTGPVASSSDFKLYLTVNWVGPEYDSSTGKHPWVKITSPNGQNFIVYSYMPAATPLVQTLSRSSAKILPGTLYSYTTSNKYPRTVYQFVTDIWHDGNAPAAIDAGDMWYGSTNFTVYGNSYTYQNSLSGLYADWMAHPTVQGKKLRQLVIPGTHDSAAYFGPSFTNREQSVTQIDNLAKQLWEGIRYFDLRIMYINSNTEPNTADGHFWIVHASDDSIYYDPGVSLQSLFDTVNAFIKAHNKEVVILDFNHFYRCDNSKIVQFANRVKNAFGARMVPTVFASWITHANGGFNQSYNVPNLMLSSYTSQNPPQQVVIGFQPMVNNVYTKSINDLFNTNLGSGYVSSIFGARWTNDDLTKEMELWSNDIGEYSGKPYLWLTGGGFANPDPVYSPYRDSNPNNLDLTIWSWNEPLFRNANIVYSNFYTGNSLRFSAITASQSNNN